MTQYIDNIDVQIKNIKDYYRKQYDEVLAKRKAITEKIITLDESQKVIASQIWQLKAERKMLGQELSKLDHDGKEATLPLRKEKHRYMEQLRYDINRAQEAENAAQ